MEHQLLQKPKQNDAVAPKRQAAPKGNTQASGMKPALGNPSEVGEQGMWANMLAGFQSQEEENQHQGEQQTSTYTQTAKLIVKEVIPHQDSSLEHSTNKTQTENLSLSSNIGTDGFDSSPVKNILGETFGYATVFCQRHFFSTEVDWKVGIFEHPLIPELGIGMGWFGFLFEPMNKKVPANFHISEPLIKEFKGKVGTSGSANKVTMDGSMAVFSTEWEKIILYVEKFTVDC